MNPQAEELKKLIDASENIVFFGGAGVSTESGIPDFRSQDGLYHQKYDYPPEEILSHTFFLRNPEGFYKFYRDKILVDGVQPNRAHKALAKLEELGKLKAIVTQNIDTLHQDAGSKVVYQIHGTIATNHCTRCNREYPLAYMKASDGVPKCESCGGIVKPDVVLYEEGLPEYEWTQSVKAIENADLLIVGGTSLVVYPAANLVRYFRHYGDNKIVLINKGETSFDGAADLVIHDSIGEILGDAVL